MPSSTAIIFDSSYLVFRSHFSHSHLRHEGKAMGAFFGFYKTVNSLINQYKPEYIYFAKDLPSPTWRHEMYPEYKAGRGEPDPEMIEQFPIINEWTGLVATQSLGVPRFEADDVIATLAKKLSQNPAIERIIIFSSDRDLYQLLTLDKVSFWQMDGKKFGKEEFKTKYGVEPADWVLYKALCGDPSDNIKGVDGVGPKTAEIYINNPETVSKKTIDKITASKEILDRNLILCKLSIIEDLEITYTKFDLSLGNMLLEKYGLKIQQQMQKRIVKAVEKKELIESKDALF
jgi:DNA polymerase I